jgi:hypothetical protein
MSNDTTKNRPAEETSPRLTQRDLEPFIGTENRYRHAINRLVLFTDGVKYLADRAGAYWLIDEIALIQPYNRSVAAEAFQVWKLKVNEDRSANLICDDGNDRIVYVKRIAFTDFPLESVVLWFAKDTILLPSEY